MLFLAITAFGIWLGWQLHIVKQRSWWIHSIRERGGAVALLDERFAIAGHVPWYRHLLGDRPVWMILYPHCPPADKEQIEAIFPESVIDYTERSSIGRSSPPM
jgi:hypothetical protein